jgi:hypothetical protein
MSEFKVVDGPLARLAYTDRLAAEIARIVWPALLDAGAVVPKSKRGGIELNEWFLDEWEPAYRSYVKHWAGDNRQQLETLLRSLAEELTSLLDVLKPTQMPKGQGGKIHSG